MRKPRSGSTSPETEVRTDGKEKILGSDATDVVIPMSAIRVDDAGTISATVTGLSFRDGRSEAAVLVDDIRIRVFDPGSLAAGQAIRLSVDETAVIPLFVDEV